MATWHQLDVDKDRRQLVRDVAELRDLAKEQALADADDDRAAELLADQGEAMERMGELAEQSVAAQQEALAAYEFHQAEASAQRETQLRELAQQSDALLSLRDVVESGQRENSAYLSGISFGVWTSNAILSGIDDTLGSINDAVWSTNGLLESVDDTLRSIDFGLAELHRTLGSGVAVLRDFAHAAVRQMKDSEAQVVGRLDRMDRFAGDRHAELIKTLRSAKGNEAEEKYGQALIHFNSHPRNVALTVRALGDALRADSTHAQAWLLFGRCAYLRNRPKSARAGFHNAVECARQRGQHETLVSASVRLSRLERLFGNFDRSCEVMRNAHNHLLLGGKWKEAPLASWRLCRYERLYAHWRHPGRPWDLPKMVKSVRYLCEGWPELRDVVAGNAFWKEVVGAWPPFRHGNSPYSSLSETLHEMRAGAAAQSQAVVWWDDDGGEGDHMGPTFDLTFLPDVSAAYELLLDLSHGGRDTIPARVSSYLTWLQGKLKDKTSTWKRGDDVEENRPDRTGICWDRFGPGHTAVVRHAYELLRSRRAGDGAHDLLITSVLHGLRRDFVDYGDKDNYWYENPRFYDLEYLLLRLDLANHLKGPGTADPAAERSLTMRLSVDLPSLLSERPLLRASAAADPMISEFGKRQKPSIEVVCGRRAKLFDAVRVLLREVQATNADPSMPYSSIERTLDYVKSRLSATKYGDIRGCAREEYFFDRIDHYLRHSVAKITAEMYSEADWQGARSHPAASLSLNKHVASWRKRDWVFHRFLHVMVKLLRQHRRAPTATRLDDAAFEEAHQLLRPLFRADGDLPYEGVSSDMFIEYRGTISWRAEEAAQRERVARELAAEAAEEQRRAAAVAAALRERQRRDAEAAAIEADVRRRRENERRVQAALAQATAERTEAARREAALAQAATERTEAARRERAWRAAIVLGSAAVAIAALLGLALWALSRLSGADGH